MSREYMSQEEYHQRHESFKLTFPLSASSLMAMCVLVGLARSQSRLEVGFLPWRSRVHTPLGPRKSGMPAEVLTYMCHTIIINMIHERKLAINCYKTP